VAIEFKKISSPDPVVAYLALEIAKHLSSRQKVLWLVTGGSAMKIVVDTANKIKSGDLKNLTVTLSDERYGPVGHQGSNWFQLKQAGFKLPGAALIPILDGGSMDKVVKRFNKILAREIKQADYKIGFIGIGPDSHIAGIKPHSPAIKAKAMATGYDWEDYRRITMTFPAIELMDLVVTYLVGRAKQEAIEALTKDASLAEVPSQILKRTKKAIIFNDKIGEAVG